MINILTLSNTELSSNRTRNTQDSHTHTLGKKDVILVGTFANVKHIICDTFIDAWFHLLVSFFFNQGEVCSLG